MRSAKIVRKNHILIEFKVKKNFPALLFSIGKSVENGRTPLKITITNLRSKKNKGKKSEEERICAVEFIIIFLIGFSVVVGIERSVVSRRFSTSIFRIFPPLFPAQLLHCIVVKDSFIKSVV